MGQHERKIYELSTMGRIQWAEIQPLWSAPERFSEKENRKSLLNPKTASELLWEAISWEASRHITR
jgi:DNA-binding PadR family transcriptional regulator